MNVLIKMKILFIIQIIIITCYLYINYYIHNILYIYYIILKKKSIRILELTRTSAPFCFELFCQMAPPTVR